MRKLATIALASVLGLAVSGVSAEATLINLTQGDSYYVGMWRPPEPANPDYEEANLNWLTDQTAGSTTSYSFGSPNATTFTHTRSSNFSSGLPDAYFNLKDDTAPFALPVTVGSYLYILGKYDGPGGGTLVWYLGTLGSTDQVNIPSSAAFPCSPAGQQGCSDSGTKTLGLSHYSLFGSEDITVPDGGTTLVLLGSALLAVGALRRKLGA